MAFRMRRKKNVNVMRVGIKLTIVIISLYVSGFLLNVIGNIMNCTSSPFYEGLELIGWTITDNWNMTAHCGDTGASTVSSNVITNTDAGTGILAIVGLVAVAWLVFEFIDFSYN